MELVLKMQWFPSSQIDFIAVDDATQEHVDGQEGGWGVETNPARADRCLVFWSVFIDYTSTEQLVSLLSSTQDVEGVVGIADGQGLLNTDKSRFLVNYIDDGHYIFYMLPIVRYASAPSGVEGDTYYNTTDKIAYYHNGTGFTPITSSELSLLYSAPGIAICEELFDLKKRYCLAVKTRELLLVINKTTAKDHKEAIRELRNKDLLWRAAFKEGKQPTARKLLKSVEDECQ